MKKFVLSLSSILMTCAAQAAAQEPAPPPISEVPIATDASIRSGVNDPTSDLPAPDTTSWVNKPLLITGATLLVAAYVPALVISQTSDRPADQSSLRYPIVGPWMDLADRGCDTRACRNEGRNQAFLIADGIVQGAGALGAVLSLLLPGKTTQHWYLIGDTQIGPMYVSNSVYGLGAAGKF